MSSDSSVSSSVSSFEFYRKQAKALQRAARAADPATLARIRVHLSQFDPNRPFLLSDAQWIIAREQGFASWPKFKHHVESQTATSSSASPTLKIAPPAGTNNQSLPEVKTASWVETSTRCNPRQAREEAPSFDTQISIRLDPPAKARHCEDEDHSWSHNVIDETGNFHTGSSSKKCHFYPRPNPVLFRGLLEEILFPPPSEVGNTADVSSEQGYRDWNQETVELEGSPVLQWQRETVEHNYRVMTTIWTEPQTHWIIRRERREIDILTSKPASLEVCDQYRYNIEIPDETFQMPPGWEIVTPDDEEDLMPEVWNTLSPQQQQTIQAMIDRSDSGWQDADFAEFAAVWKFGCLDYLPDQSQCRERVEQQAGLWRQWVSEVESANTQDFIPLQVDTHTFTWGGKRKVLWVRVKLRVEWGDEGVWEGNASFYLRRTSRSYQVVHWECPWEEIKAARSGNQQA